MTRIPNARRIVHTAVGWGLVWTLTWIVVGSVIGALNPGTIDPGESPLVMGPLIFGPMGFLSGLAFALLLAGTSAPGPKGSVPRAALCGMAGSALAQVPYLGHGDQGLASNAKMATLFVAFGGVVAVLWVSAEHAWRRRRRAD